MSAKVDFNLHPFVVIWESTRACDLSCVHCRAAAQPRRSQFELTTEEGYKLIDDIALLKPKVFVITGGDPLKREDTYDYIAYAKKRGLEPSVTPSATPLLTEGAIALMKHRGVARLAVSLDASRADLHDGFRRVPGSFDITINAIRTAAREGIPVQVNTTVTRRTVDDLPQMVNLLRDLGIVMWSVFFLVPTGRGKQADLITPEAVEQLFGYLYETSKRVPFAIRTTEAMHYRRYMLQRMAAERGESIDNLLDPTTGLIDASTLFLQNGPRKMPLGVQAQTGAVSRAPRGVNEGKGFVFISHLGDVFPSGFLPLKAGNVKHQSLGEIYRSSDLFTGLRDSSNLKGKCGVCEFRDLCGGSRARAWAMTGDVYAADPLCTYVPAGMRYATA
ncbi:MAG TPA: TIGR04053 family radical SAM/SPASM domain-containing protein [Thermoanaerobaculia bacterium]|jgi:radical SAM protein|nr:TIGR04053 family radical SAM/SPASM domain-containing protein [Thermoanaerobaculia bacterium]